MFPGFPRDLPRLIAALVIFAGFVVLAGWEFRIPLLKGQGFGTFVAPNTAACFILCGVALLLSNASPKLQILSRVLAGIVFAFAGLTLIQFITGADLGIDRMLMPRHLENWTIPGPQGRFAWTTGISFLFVSAALVVQHLNRPLSQLAEILAGMSILTAFMSLLGRFYSAQTFYGRWMAPHTTALFLLFGVGVMAGPARGPFTKAVSSQGPGGMLARRFLFVTFAVIPVLGWLRLFLFRYDLGNYEFGTALLIVAIIVVLVPFIFSTAFRLDRSEEKRETTTAALLQAEKLAAAGRFAAQISHEINNPLASVTNLLYLARNSSDGKQAHYLALAEQELARVAHITKQSLGFYRDAAKPRTVLAAPFVREIVALLEPKWRARGVAVECSIAEDVTFFANLGEIRQVLSNLIVNAVEASGPGNVVTLATDTTGHRTLIHVIDHGSGIPTALITRVFEPFFTTKSNGSGLGLWITRDLVAKNGGTLKMVSSTEPPTGTTFTLDLLQKESAQRPQVSQSA